MDKGRTGEAAQGKAATAPQSSSQEPGGPGRGRSQGSRQEPGGPGRAPRVLFVCVGNAGRSQMAEAFARKAGLEAESAGTEPASKVSSAAAAAMKEKGIDISAQKPKPLDWDRLKEFDRVVTMGCGVAESCPSLKTDEDWGLDDPAGQPVDSVRPIRDEIERRVQNLANELRSKAK